MPRWKVISVQTREKTGELEAASQREARALLEQQLDAEARYFELSEYTSPARATEPMELCLKQVASIVRDWAIEKCLFPPEVQVDFLLRGNQYLTTEALVARVHVPTEEGPGLEVTAEDLEEDTTEQTLP